MRNGSVVEWHHQRFVHLVYRLRDCSCVLSLHQTLVTRRFAIARLNRLVSHLIASIDARITLIDANSIASATHSQSVVHVSLYLFKLIN